MTQREVIATYMPNKICFFSVQQSTTHHVNAAVALYDTQSNCAAALCFRANAEGKDSYIGRLSGMRVENNERGDMPRLESSQGHCRELRFA